METKCPICAHCGAKMVQYRFNLNNTLVSALGKIYKKASHGSTPVELNKILFTKTEWTNVQKLRYWGLIDRYVTEETKHKQGWWVITQKGFDFISGVTTVPKCATTMRNTVLSLDGDQVSFNKNGVLDAIQHRGDYRDQVSEQIENAAQRD